MILETLMFVIGFYLFTMLSVYSYSVFKTWEHTGIWDFRIKDGYIGICAYPQWLLGWIERIESRLGNRIRRD